MLLYNHKQEFIGIDEDGLKLLNYVSFEELLNVCTDVADLFANEPGYIHNFKNFGWIDFILHSDSDVSSAIVHANGRVFSCQLSISSFYLRESPSQNGYRIEMLHIKNMSGEEIKPHIIIPKERPKEFVKEFIPPHINVSDHLPSSLVDHTHIAPVQLSEPSALDIPLTELSEHEDLYTGFSPSQQHLEFDEPLPFLEEITEEITPLKPPVLKQIHYSESEKEYISHHKVAKEYLFDPSVAANELGLPVDLIEEFIGDFIQQSHDFKEELFEACAKNDFNNLHILSHKLKGVAANLRIEDALETLTIINTSTEVGEIEANLKYYYKIVAKLEGKEEEEYEFQPSPEIPESTLLEATITKAIISEPMVPKMSDDIYAFAPKQHDDELLLVHNETEKESNSQEELQSKEDISFEKEFFDLNLLDIEETKEIEPEKKIEKLEESSVNNHVILHYDFHSTSRALGIEPSFMQELINDYKHDAAIISEEIANAISAFDTVLWNENASKLKGISDNLRLNEISDELAVLIKTHDAQEAKKASNRLMGYLDQL